MSKVRTYLYDVYIEKRSTKTGTKMIGRTAHNIVRGTSMESVKMAQRKSNPHTETVRKLIFVFRHY